MRSGKGRSDNRMNNTKKGNDGITKLLKNEKLKIPTGKKRKVLLEIVLNLILIIC